MNTKDKPEVTVRKDIDWQKFAMDNDMSSEEFQASILTMAASIMHINIASQEGTNTMLFTAAGVVVQAQIIPESESESESETETEVDDFDDFDNLTTSEGQSIN